MAHDYYRSERKHWLYVCRGYWQGTTCANKRPAQRALANLRQCRALGLV